MTWFLHEGETVIQLRMLGTYSADRTGTPLEERREIRVNSIRSGYTAGQMLSGAYNVSGN